MKKYSNGRSILMKKQWKLIIFFIIVIIIVLLNYHQVNRKEETFDRNAIIEISVIDKYDQIKDIHENPEAEEYALVDIVIDGVYYKKCGIRTKGSTIYKSMKRNHIDDYSYKIKLDYRNKNQNYKGISEFHVNSSIYDATRHKGTFSI